MALLRIARNPILSNLLKASSSSESQVMVMRLKTHFRSGAIKPKPDTTSFGIVGVLCAVLPGLFIGAAISKSVANFLEENDLFVPSDDDDDED